jgi:hypothetical protein
LVYDKPTAFIPYVYITAQLKAASDCANQSEPEIPQQRLNEMASSLAILTAYGTNEFNRTHWTIKPVNLVEELRRAGLTLPVPTQPLTNPSKPKLSLVFPT